MARTHGLASTYSAGCRCDDCRAAKGVKDQRRRDRRRRESLAGALDVPHGTEVGYDKYYCRCDRCREARFAYARDWSTRNPEKVRGYHERHDKPWRAKVQADTQQTAHHAGDEWTGAELEVVTRTDLPLRELAKLLGRSFSACANARHRATHDPAWIQVVGTGGTIE